MTVSISTTQKISTHSLTRRLTYGTVRCIVSLRYFNSQPHKEADKKAVSRFRNICYFNSQPHKEADEKQVMLLRLLITFQLTASQGG